MTGVIFNFNFTVCHLFTIDKSGNYFLKRRQPDSYCGRTTFPPRWDFIKFFFNLIGKEEKNGGRVAIYFCQKSKEIPTNTIFGILSHDTVAQPHRKL